MISWISVVELGAVIVAILLGALYAVNRICASVDGVRQEISLLRERVDSIDPLAEGARRDP